MISVIIPSVRSNTVGDTIAAITEQTDGDWELIVSDQSGNDSLESLIRKYADPRIRRVRCPGRGAAQARNYGITHAKSDILAFTDDDCRPRPDWLATIRELFEADPDLWMVTGTLAAPSPLPSGFHTGDTYAPLERQARPSEGHARIYSVTANAAYRRVAFEKAGPFDVCLSPGTIFCGGEEDDHGQRMEIFDPVLLSTPRLEVEHTHGIRVGLKATWSLRRNYAISVGALAGKRSLLGGDGKHLAKQETVAALKKLFLRPPTETIPSVLRAYYVWRGYHLLVRNYQVDRRLRLLQPRGKDLASLYPGTDRLLDYDLGV